MDYERMTPEEFRELQLLIDSGELGDDVAFACNADPSEHIHARRLGPAVDRRSRVGVMAHGANGSATVWLNRWEARQLAASLLNIADELDGKTPLLFMPGGVSE